MWLVRVWPVFRVARSKFLLHTIDELVDGARVSILKMDVEGYEFQVIQGARNTLRQASAVIVELNGSGNRYGHTDAEVVALLRSLGYSSYRYVPEEHRIEEVGAEEMAKSPNAIFVRDVEGIRKALARAIRYDVGGVQV